MKTAFNIARVELQVLFYSPIAWFILIMFTFQVGMFFCPTFGGISDLSGYREPIAGGTFISGFCIPGRNFRDHAGVFIPLYPVDHDGFNESRAGKWVY